MSAGTSEFFCLICLLLCSCTAQKNIRAKLGQDVILPCKVPNNINDITAVAWKRPGLDPEHVLLYRDGRLDPHNQHPSYQNRVDLQDKNMKDGDVSLILKNVKMEDPGTYQCRVSQKGKTEPFSIINLKVYLSDETKITAELGQDVILPCKVPNNIIINDITAVGWKRPGLNPEHVLLYRDGRLDPHNQHPSYQNRVDLQDKEMKNGDVSLILKNVKKEDTGTYECEKEKKYLISIINLEVLPSDHSWKIIVGVGVPLGVIILSAAGFVVYKKLQIRKRNQEWQELLEPLKGNNSETKNQLQQEKLKNEALKDEIKILKNGIKILVDELKELKGNHSDTISQLQQQKQKNETLENDIKILEIELEELIRSFSETSSQLSLMIERIEFLENRLMKRMESDKVKNQMQELDEMNSDTNSDPTGSDEKNQQEELEKLQDDKQKLMKTVGNLKTELQNMNQKLELMGTKTAEVL